MKSLLKLILFSALPNFIIIKSEASSPFPVYCALELKRLMTLGNEILKSGVIGKFIVNDQSEKYAASTIFIEIIKVNFLEIITLKEANITNTIKIKILTSLIERVSIKKIDLIQNLENEIINIKRFVSREMNNIMENEKFSEPVENFSEFEEQHPKLVQDLLKFSELEDKDETNEQKLYLLIFDSLLKRMEIYLSNINKELEDKNIKLDYIIQMLKASPSTPSSINIEYLL